MTKEQVLDKAGTLVSGPLPEVDRKIKELMDRKK